MSWVVEFTDEFERWWSELDEVVQDGVDRGVRLLEAKGPSLPFPHSSDIRNSRHGNLRELRVQVGGEPYRVFYAFDPRRTAILLIGGCKTGDDRFYERMVPMAERIYDEHLADLDRLDDSRGDPEEK